MNKDFLDGCDNLFVIFPAGLGGNHLANLISTLPQFEPRDDYDDVVADLTTQYTDFFFRSEHINAHFSKLQNLQPEYIIRHSEWLANSKRINLFCSHLKEYRYACSDGLIDPFKNRKFILITYPRKNEIALARMKNGPWSSGDLASASDYDVSNFIRYLSKFDSTEVTEDSPILILDGDKFFTSDGMDHIIEILSPHLGEFPKSCRMMHEFWYGGIVRSGIQYKSQG